MIPILLAAALSAPCETYDETVATLRENGAVVMEIPDHMMPGGADRGFIFNNGQLVIMGLEHEGCLLPPIPMGRAGSVVH